MISVKTDFQNRKSEIEDYYALLGDIMDKNARLLFPDGTKKTFHVDLTATLKSGAILMLYNLVESTISNLVDKIHETFTDSNLGYDGLNDKIQEKILKHYYTILRKNEGINESNRLSELRSVVGILGFGDPVKLYYEDFIKYKKGSQFSGNLDSKLIKKIVNSYGITVNNEASELRTVRDKRNKLSHGELSFKETCNNDSLIYMNVLKNKTIDFLEEVINSVEDYINNKGYEG